MRLAAIFFVVASLARLWFAVVRPLWHDEFFTVWVSRMGLGAMLTQLRSDSGPPLFYLLCRPLVWIGEAWALPDSVVRLVPFAAIAALAIAARSLRTTGARAAYLGLLAGSALLGYYAAEARAYALLALVDLALFLETRKDRDDPRHLAIVGLWTAIAVLTHYLAILFVVALGVAVLLDRRWKKAAAIAGGLVLAAPWLPVLLRQPAAATGWMRERLLDTLPSFLSALGGAGRMPIGITSAVSTPLHWLGVPVGIALVGWLWTKRREDPETRAALVVVGLTLALAASAGLLRPIAFPGRTEMAILPIWLWALARRCEGDRVVRALSMAAVGLGTILFAAGAADAMGRSESNPSRFSAAIGPLTTDSDLVVVASEFFYLPLELAHERGAVKAQILAFPEEIARHPGWVAGTPPEASDYAALARALDERPAGSRAWLATSRFTPQLREIFVSRGTLRPALSLPDAEVFVWTKSKPAP